MLKKKETIINVTVKTVNHPNPQVLVDIWSSIVLKEILKREQEGAISEPA